MKICIIGAGKVGLEIAKRVIEDNHDVILIDRNGDKLEAITEKLDVLTIKGNGGTSQIINNPVVTESDLLVAVTSSDEINIIACMKAKKNGVGKTVARVRDPDYAYDLLASKDEWGIDLLINPEYAAATEIAQQLTLLFPTHTELFGAGKILMAEIAVDDVKFDISKKRLHELDCFFPKSIRVVAISRRGEMLIPGGKDYLLPGDRIYVLGNLDSISQLCYRLKGKKRRVQNVMILGGGRIGYYLASKLESMGIKVKLVERDEDKCEELAERLPNVLVLNADGTDIDFLQNEGIKDTDGFVAVTGFDEENLLISLLAKQMGAKQVVAKVSRPSYAAMVERLGVDNAVSPRLITVSKILRFIRGGKLLNMFLLPNGQAEVVELIVQKGSKLADKSLEKAGIPRGIIIGAILRQNKAIIPEGKEIIREGDRLVVFSLGNYLQKVEALAGSGGL
ncbi:trk system potassium uptake protein TrkA [Desulfohalotomaculum tongense]|uniref:Trk system potassium transporter TrkA n=1 Tax=Desulforadius tongensis TaxID=1216062 RepID=UPI00195B4552|nr:trk system potassium uptake protein TrkA [Desulforadius tongensis]